jgi:hypothetical protein
VDAPRTAGLEAGATFPESTQELHVGDIDSIDIASLALLLCQEPLREESN